MDDQCPEQAPNNSAPAELAAAIRAQGKQAPARNFNRDLNNLPHLPGCVQENIESEPRGCVYQNFEDSFSEVFDEKEETKHKDELLTKERERHDTITLQKDAIVMKLTQQLESQQQLLEYHQEPFYRRWFRKKHKEDLR